jgi:hypothetical protein
MDGLRRWLKLNWPNKVPRSQLVGAVWFYAIWSAVFGLTGLWDRWDTFLRTSERSYWWLLGALFLLACPLAFAPYSVNRTKGQLYQYAEHGVMLALRGLVLFATIILSQCLWYLPLPALIVIKWLCFAAIPIVTLLIAREFILRANAKETVRAFYKSILAGAPSQASAMDSALADAAGLEATSGKPTWFSITGANRDDARQLKVQVVTTRNKALGIEEALFDPRSKKVAHLSRVLDVPTPIATQAANLSSSHCHPSVMTKGRE